MTVTSKDGVEQGASLARQLFAGMTVTPKGGVEQENVSFKTGTSDKAGDSGVQRNNGTSDKAGDSGVQRNNGTSDKVGLQNVRNGKTHKGGLVKKRTGGL